MVKQLKTRWMYHLCSISGEGGGERGKKRREGGEEGKEVGVGWYEEKRAEG